MKIGRRVKVAAGASAVIVIAVTASFGPLVRARVGGVAERLGATVEIETVRPAWNGVVLRGVSLRFADLPSVRVALDEVDVRGVISGPRSVRARGGTLEAVAEPDALASEVAALRARLGERAGEPGGGARTEIAIEGVRARWTPHEGSSDEVLITGLRAARPEGPTVRFESEAVKASLRGASATAEGLEVELLRAEGGVRIAVLAARAAHVDVSDRAAVDGAPRQPAEGSEGAVGSLPSRARARVQTLAAELDARLTPDARVEVEALSAKLRANDQALSVGPGRFALRRESGPPRRLVVEVAQVSDEKDARRLALRLAAPYGDGSADAPIVVEIHGGPIPLAAVGLREGDLGLVEPDRAWLEADATVEIDDARNLVRFSGEGRVRGLSLQHRAVAEQPIRGLDVGFRGKAQAALDGASLQVERGELEVGALRVLGSGEVKRRRGGAGKPDDWAVDLSWDVPLVACQSLLDAAPAGLLPLVSGSTMAGSLALKGSAKFDTASLDRTYDVKWESAVGCRMVAPRPLVAVERFMKAFKKTIYSPEGARSEAEFGPGTEAWTPSSRIAPIMETAVVTAEDGRFHRHGGFDHEAIRNSIRENIRARRFVRGASTVSMQLAKNLYLPRDKTLSRKLEEAILTLYLEQVLTKEQMIELYLNVVEFGPMVYGIGPAARHYFRTSPAALTVTQAFYLASILPSPRKQHFAPGGAVSGGWMTHLRRMMKYAHHRGRLNDAELDEGMTEVPVFGSPNPIREARDPVEDDPGDGALRREPWTDAEGDG